MKNIEAVTKICPFITNGDSRMPYVLCLCEKCMAWENTSFGTNIKDEDKDGYCKRLEK